MGGCGSRRRPRSARIRSLVRGASRCWAPTARRSTDYGSRGHRRARRPDRQRPDQRRGGRRRSRSSTPRPDAGHRRARLDDDLRRVPDREPDVRPAPVLAAEGRPRGAVQLATPGPRRGRPDGRSGSPAGTPAGGRRTARGRRTWSRGNVLPPHRVEARRRRDAGRRLGHRRASRARRSATSARTPATSRRRPAAATTRSGQAHDSASDDTLAVVRFTATGALDPGFSDDGIVLQRLRPTGPASRPARLHDDAAAVLRRRRHGGQRRRGQLVFPMADGGVLVMGTAGTADFVRGSAAASRSCSPATRRRALPFPGFGTNGIVQLYRNGLVGGSRVRSRRRCAAPTRC